MVQEIRNNEPQYICFIPTETLTGVADDEIMTFGVDPEAAKQSAQDFLASIYGCNESQIFELMEKARIEPIGQWCSVDSQD